MGIDGQPVEGALVAVNSHPHKSTRSEADGSLSFSSSLESSYCIEARLGTAVARLDDWQLTRRSEPAILRLRTGGAMTVHVREWSIHSPVVGTHVEIDTVIPNKMTTDKLGRGP